MLAKNKQLDVVGITEYVTIGDYQKIPAKIDTGADSSAIWASDIQVDQDGVLSFCLFGKKSPFYTGEIIRRTDYKVVAIRNSFGNKEIRYRTHFKVAIKGRTINVSFSLADRSRNNFPILIGRRTISGKFYVDVSKESVKMPKKAVTLKLNRELKNNPHQFHQKYIERSE